MVLPDLSKPVQWADHLKRERGNFRNATRTLIERVDREADERQQSGEAIVKRASNMARRIFDLKRSKWRQAQERWEEGAEQRVQVISARADETDASIRSTEASYREFMKLKAPVEYWQQKSADHGSREAKARGALYIYFPVALVLLAITFISAGAFLLRHPDTDQAKSPIALYVVVSGGLFLLSTVAFWIGRLLTKLYLSEHHLRNDAEERAVMTTTYLALTTEGAATETDRQIILGALFRSTPDGIVKDDGPSDASVQGLLTKLLMR